MTGTLNRKKSELPTWSCPWPGLLKRSNLEKGELEAYFDENKHNYEVEETREVKQILIKLPEEPSEALVEQMKAKADELHALVKEGKELQDVSVNYAGEHEGSIEFSEFGFLSKGVLEAGSR